MATLLAEAGAILGPDATDNFRAMLEKGDTAAMLAKIVELANKNRAAETTLQVVQTLNSGTGVKDREKDYLQQTMQNVFSDAQTNASVPTIKALLEGKFALNGDRYPHDLCNYREHTTPLPRDFLGRFLGNLLGDMPYKTYRSGSQLTMTAFTVNASALEAIGAAKDQLGKSMSALTRYRYAVTGCEDDPNELQDMQEELVGLQNEVL